MSGTKIKENINYYNRVLNRDASRVQDGAYKEVLDKLRILMEKTEELYRPDEQGHYRQMTENGYQSLISSYQDMEKACSDYFGDSRKKKDLDKSRAHIVKRLQGYVSKDLSCLEKLEKDHLPSLPDAIRQARTVQIDLTGKTLTTIGGAQSKRIPLKSSSGKTGFFTEKVGYNRQKSWEELLDGILPKIPENFREDFMSLRYNKSSRNDFLRLMTRYDAALKKKNETIQVDILIKMYETMTGRSSTSTENFDIRFGRKDNGMDQLVACFEEMVKKSYGMRVRDNHIKTAGIKNVERLDQRNSAMSAVADLLGSPNVIAKSTPMTILRDGKVVEGTFMESAEGTDIKHPGKQDMWLRNKREYHFGEPDTLKQLAELQVLDYICGNIDRHRSNMLYQFEEKDGKVCLTKITGIDNDDSFGTNLLDDEDTGLTFQPGVTAINVISSGQANVIHNLNKDVLKEVLLPYELTDQEIDAVWDRTNCLKKEIKRGNIAVVRDSEWKNQKFSKLAKGNNIFTRVKDLSLILESINLTHAKSLDYVQGEKVPEAKQFHMNFEQGHNKLMRLVKQVHDADRNLYINSSAFRKMRNTLYELGKFSKELKEKHPEEDMKIEPEELKELNRRYAELKKISEAYIEAKKLSPKTDHGQLRLSLANELRDLCIDSLDLLEPDDLKLDTQEHQSHELIEPRKEEIQIDEGPELH